MNRIPEFKSNFKPKVVEFEPTYQPSPEQKAKIEAKYFTGNRLDYSKSESRRNEINSNGNSRQLSRDVASIRKEIGCTIGAKKILNDCIRLGDKSVESLEEILPHQTVMKLKHKWNQGSKPSNRFAKQ